MTSHYSQGFIERLQQLQSLAQNKYGIEIASEKFIADESYRKLVLNELSLLGDSELSAVIAAMQDMQQQQGASPTTGASEQISKDKASTPLSLIFAGVAVVLALVATGYTFYVNQEPDIAMASKPAASTQVNTAQQPTDNGRVQEKEQQRAQLAFRIHGSNTIGEKLAPALLEGYLKELGAKQFNWRQGEVSVERELHYQLDSKPYYIELHAHGSSTGFADIEAGKADLAMASRKVKSKDVDKLKARFGDFSQIGNEHIIGLDGLAVIVNQNNPVSHLSTQQLAAVFSGKISNWRELGGPSEAINLYARDAKSGTWDTFKNLVLKKHQAQLSPLAQRFESSSVLSQKVSQDEYGIGFIGLNYILHNKAIAVSEGAQTAPIYPTRFTIGTEDYALARRLYVYTPTTASMFIKNFAQYAISYAGQEIVSDTGLISQNIHVEQVQPMTEAPTVYKQYAKQGQRLSLTFRFEHGSGQLDNKGKRDLQRLLDYLESHAQKRVILMGFSDNSGDAGRNKTLSLQRARSVEQELTARGVAVFDTQGFGEVLPVANNQSKEGRERNRRVEVWVL
ncbi:cell envelope biogenesis protein OmpA [Pseudoalteromonas ruthenica]|uniref:phosphate ABC transporter substrate-binding/OmpA family protein n=1 Tax=Pseudoalteromonas ruthenica TaxID=151081 RepID=UPI0011081CA5|nr:phosphate ABC transporter substrate-binding/OmpA family protein [Pseudoalteromonas ruthenica]TLX51771.1 cell envelope biogenesis protein OmpA [Pseudoalteromonas ruthenica]